MAALTWDQDGARVYETGVDHGALYVVDSSTGKYGKGVAWNGLTKVTETPSGADISDVYADNTKYLSLQSAETFEGTIEAYTFPDEFMACDGTEAAEAGVYLGQQARAKFGIAYRTVKGNDTKGNAFGEKIHVLYGLTAKPSERAYSTINDSPEAISFSWSVKSTPAAVTGHKPVSVIPLDSTVLTAAKYKAAKETLFGKSDADPKLPTPDELITAIKSAA